MLEICLSSLIWSVNLGSHLELEPAFPLEPLSSQVDLANGKPYESDYSREAEQERQRRDIWHHGEDSSETEVSDPNFYRIHRRNYDYRREIEREPDNEPRSEEEYDYDPRDLNDRRRDPEPELRHLYDLIR